MLTYHTWRDKFKDGKLGDIITNSKPSIVTMLFRSVLVNYPREFNKTPNGDTFLCFMLKMKGELHFIDGVDPGIRVLHDANLMGNLGETDILPRQIGTNKQIYLFAKNTKKKQKKIIYSLS